MKRENIIAWLILCFIVSSCDKIKDYFKQPDCSSLIESIHDAIITAYSAETAMASMNGYPVQNAVTTRSNEGYPCTSLTVINIGESDISGLSEKASTVTVAGLWPDSATAILSMIFTDYVTETNTFEVLGIETIPVIKKGNSLQVVMAGQDISLNPDQQSVLSINLSTLEIQSELLRLEALPPSDVYVAILQKAYFIEVNTSNTEGNPFDDLYAITGGGQLVEVSGNDAEIIQQAMVDVYISPDCTENPVNGMALLKVTGTENNGFPELGTAVLEFNERCTGSAKVFAATGMFTRAIGKNITFLL